MFMFHKAGLVWLLASSIFTPLLAAPAPETAVNPRSVGAPEVYDELSAPVIEAREVEKRASPFQGLKRRGMAASQARLLMLTARKSDLELQMQFVSQRRMQLANAVAALQASRASASPSQQSEIDRRVSEIQKVDKQLDLEMKRLEVQHKAVQTEIESVQKVLQKNIETSFKIMG